MRKSILLMIALVTGIVSYGQWTDNGSWVTTPDNVGISGKNVLQLGHGLTKEQHAGKIVYQGWSAGLDIVGAGTTTAERQITLHAQGGLRIHGPLINHLFIKDKNILEFGKGLAKEQHAGKIGYQVWTTGLDIVGAGATTADRKITFHAQGGATVIGKMHADTYTAKTPPWSDFVFEDNYTLPSLELVERFIKENKHLPDVPSETELQETGLNLPEMDAKLLQKIEELTLYLIEQNKKIEAQQKEIEALKKKVTE